MTNKEAIEYLKGQIKCRKCETGIDCEKCRPNWSIENDIEALKKGIEALENQKTGHWIDDNDGHGTSCSECGKWYTHQYLTKEEIIYCCRCGAKMEGE